MIDQQVFQSRPFFYGVFAFVALLVFSCLSTVTFSLVMIIILKPVYDFFFRRRLF